MLLIAYIVPTFFILLYALFIYRTGKAWQAMQSFEPENKFKPEQLISVLVPFRNELNNLPNLLADLRAQSFPAHLVEFIFVNDHSEDGGAQYLKTHLASLPNSQVISLEAEQTGKKSALQKGLEVSKGDIIVTIDADVRLQKSWLIHLSAFHHLEVPALTILPVAMQTERKFWKNLVRIEWLSLMALTAGSAARQMALMCNGANLSMERDALLQIGGFKPHEMTSSGDDMFTLIAMKRLGPNSVKYLWNDEVVARVRMPATFSMFISQRIRWISKLKRLQDFQISYSGLILLCGNAALLLSVIISFFVEEHWLLSVFLLGIKVIAEHSLIQKSAARLGEKIREIDVILLSIIYPLYLISLPLVGFFYKPKWKGRAIQV